MKKLLLLVSIFLLANAFPVIAGDAPLMDKDVLKAKIGSDNLVILDVRAGKDWSSSEFKIQGAVRVQADKIGEWSANYPKDKALVLYCA